MGGMMGKIIRREFVGNRWIFFALCIFVITLPFAVMYFLEAAVTVENQMEDPEEFMDALRQGKIGNK
jgi:hypothetical protein